MDIISYGLAAKANKGVKELSANTPRPVKVVATGDGSATEFAVENDVNEPMTVLVEGYVIDEADYTRDTGKVTFDTAPDDNEQIVIQTYKHI